MNRFIVGLVGLLWAGSALSGPLSDRTALTGANTLSTDIFMVIDLSASAGSKTKKQTASELAVTVANNFATDAISGDDVEGGTIGSVTITTLTLGNDLTVANGGTGASSLTDGGLLLGSGTGAVTALGVATNGQIPIGDGATDPVLATITAGSGIGIANGAGSITVSADLGTTIVTGEITDGTILEADLNVDVTAVDGDFLTFDSTGSNFTWRSPAETLSDIGAITASSTDTFTNKTLDCNGTGNSCTNIDVADLANGTDGELITWSSSAGPTTVAVGTATHVLTSNGAGVAPTFQAAGGGSPTKEFFVPVTANIVAFPYTNDTYGSKHSSAAINATGEVKFNFMIPNDFSSITTATVVIIADTSETVQWDCSTEFGADNESYQAHTDSLVDQTEAVTQDAMEELDISGCLTAIAGGDHVGLRFESDTATLYVRGLRFRY